MKPAKRKDDRASQLALWRAFEAAYLSLCREGQCEFDPKMLRALWTEFQRDQRAGFQSLFSSTRH
jgi:hypothetical protein